MAEIFVSSGVTNTSPVVSGTTMHVLSGGSVRENSVRVGGSMLVSAGADAHLITEDGGYVLIYNGFRSYSFLPHVFSNLALTDRGGGATVHSGTTAYNTTLYSATHMYVYSGGLAQRTNLRRGSLHVFSGGLATSTNVCSSGIVDVANGGCVDLITVSDSGVLHVSSGGLSISATIDSLGILNVSSGGTANSTTVNSLGIEKVYSGGTAYETHVSSGGSLDLLPGAIASRASIYGTVTVSNGARAYYMMIESGGRMVVSEGGLGKYSIVDDYGVAIVSSGGSIEYTTVYSHGYMDVLSGARVSEIGLYSSGALYVSSGGLAKNTTVSSTGSLYVRDGGTLGGTLQIESGGVVSARSGAQIMFNLENREVQDPALINDWSRIIGGENAVYSVTVSANAANGRYALAENAANFDNSVAVSVGSAVLGSLSIGHRVSYAGNYYFLVKDSDGILSFWVRDTAFVDHFDSGQTVYGYILVGDTLYVSNNSISLYAIVNEGSKLFVLDSSLAQYTEVYYSAAMTVSSGGLADSTTVHEGGELYVKQGGFATMTTVSSGGSMTVSSGGRVSSAYIHPTGYVDVLAGGSVCSMTLHGRADVYKGIVDTPSVLGLLNVTSALSISCSVINGEMNLYGGTATDARAYGHGRIGVFQGGLARDTIIYSGTSMFVSGQGVASNTIVYARMDLIGNSATAYDTLVGSTGEMYVSSNASAVGTVLDSSAYMLIYGGLARSTIVNSGALMYVYDGGIAHGVTVNSDGGLRIFSGGTLEGDLRTENSAHVNVDSGGIINFNLKDRAPNDPSMIDYWSRINFKTGAECCVSLSADQAHGKYRLANHVPSPPDVSVNIDDVVVDNFDIGSYCVYRDRIYAYVQDHYNNDGNNLYFLVRDGFYVIHMDQGYTGYDYQLVGEDVAYIHSGGCVNKTTINEDACVYVYNGGLAQFTAVHHGGTLVVSSGGFADNVVVFSSGSLCVYQGGYVISAEVHGDLLVSSGGVVDHATILSDLGARVYSGGLMTNASVLNVLYISGGTASNTDMWSRSWMVICDGGLACNTEVYGANLKVSSGVAMETIVCSSGQMYVSSGGTAVGTSANSESMIYVFSGGVASNTSVGQDAGFVVSSGGTMCGTLRGNGAVTFLPGAHVVFDLEEREAGGSALISNWSMIDGGADADYAITVSADQALGTYLLAGSASAFDNSIALSIGNGAAFSISVGQTLNYMGKDYSLVKSLGNELQFTIVNGTVSEYDVDFGVTSSGIMLASNSMRVNRGGTASNTDIHEGGNMTVSSGGTAVGTIVNSGGSMIVGAGGVVAYTIENGGYVSIAHDLFPAGNIFMDEDIPEFSRHSFSDLVLSNASATVHSGTTAIRTSVDPTGGLFVYRGGSASDITENGGFVYVEDGGDADFARHSFSGLVLSNTSATVHSGTTAVGANLISGAVMFVYSGGTAADTSICAHMEVSSGGVVAGAIVSNGGDLDVYSGGVANSTTVNSSCILRVYSGGVVNGTVLNEGGDLIVSSGAAMNSTTINSGGSLNVSSGVAATDTDINSGGSLTVSSGGAVTDTDINSGGSMVVYNGGIANGAVVKAGGRMDISRGAVLRGPLQISAGATASAYTGAKIVFDLEDRTTADPVLIDGWYRLSGRDNADYCVTVSASQAAGTYMLADSATDFSNNVSVKVGGVDAGTISVGGSLTYDGTTYVLMKGSGILQFTVLPPSGDDAYIVTSLVDAHVVRNVYIVGTDVSLEDDVVGGTIYGATGTSVPTARKISIDSTSAKRFYAGGSFTDGITQTGTKALVQATITGSTFSGGLFMGANAVDSTIMNNVKLTAEGAASKLIMGGGNVGKRFIGDVAQINSLTVNGYVDMKLTDCTATSFCCGGSLLSNECQENRTGVTEISISGGIYDAVAGGSLFQSKATNNMYSIINGNIGISVSGNAKIQTLYGASTAVYVGPTRKETVNGDIMIQVNVSEGAQVEKSIYVGGAGFCTVNGMGFVDIYGKGEGDILTTSNLVGASTYAAGDDRRIGDTYLTFEGFCGTVNSRITFFTRIAVSAASSVNFTDYRSDFSCKDWLILADSANRESVILSGNNLSKGRVHNIDFNNSSLNFQCELHEGDEWTIFKVMDDNEDFQTLCNFSDANEFTLNGEEIEWDDDELCGISENETYKIEYRFDESENCGMLVASLFS